MSRYLACLCQDRVASKYLSCNSMPSGLGLPKLMCRVEILMWHQSVWSMTLLSLLVQIKVSCSVSKFELRSNVKVCQSYWRNYGGPTTQCLSCRKKVGSKFGIQLTGREAILIMAHMLKVKNLYFAGQATQKLRSSVTPYICELWANHM